MKTYFVSLDRSRERAAHIRQHVLERGLDGSKISAVDGRKLTREDLERECDIARVDRLRHWLTDGALACAMSHRIAYRNFLETEDKVAFFIEDDIILPENIHDLLNAIAKEIRDDEVVLLMYTSSSPVAFSKVDSRPLLDGSVGLHYPMDLKLMMCAGAYCLGRKAAEGLLRVNTPIRSTADSWWEFHSKGAFAKLRVVYPALVSAMNFKSSIDYMRHGSMKAIVAGWVDRFRPPLLHQAVARRRLATLKKLVGNYSLVEERSPWGDTP